MILRFNNLNSRHRSVIISQLRFAWRLGYLWFSLIPLLTELLLLLLLLFTSKDGIIGSVGHSIHRLIHPVFHQVLTQQLKSGLLCHSPAKPCSNHIDSILHYNIGCDVTHKQSSMFNIEAQVVKSLTNQDVTVSVEAAFLTSLSQKALF